MTRCARSLPLLLLLSALAAAAPPSATAPCNSGRPCEGRPQKPQGDPVSLVPLALVPATTSDDRRRPIATITLFTVDEATAEGDCKGMRKLLEEQLVTNAELLAGNAQLKKSIAALQQQLEDVTETMSENQAMLLDALENNLEEVVDALKKTPGAPAATSETPSVVHPTLTDEEHRALSKKLLEAAEHDKMKEMQQLLAQGADVHYKDYQGYTALHWAAWNGNLPAMGLLVDRGANIDERNSYDNTPLHWAAWNGRLAAVEALVAKGANVNAQNNEGDTPLIFAAERKGEDPVGTVRALLKLGADPKIKGKHGTTARGRASSDEIRALL